MLDGQPRGVMRGCAQKAQRFVANTVVTFECQPYPKKECICQRESIDTYYVTAEYRWRRRREGGCWVSVIKVLGEPQR